MTLSQKVADILFLPPRRGKVRMGVLRTQLKTGTPIFILPRPGRGKMPTWFLFFVVAVQAAETPKERVTFAYAAISPSMSAVWMAKEIGAFERTGCMPSWFISARALRRSRHWWAAAFKPRWARAMRWSQRPSRARRSSPSRATAAAPACSFGCSPRLESGTVAGEDACHHPFRVDERFCHAAYLAKTQSRR